MSNKIPAPVSIPVVVRNSYASSANSNLPRGSSYFTNYHNQASIISNSNPEAEPVMDSDVSFKIHVSLQDRDLDLLDLFHIDFSDTEENNNHNSPASGNFNRNLTVPSVTNHCNFTTRIDREYLDEYKSNENIEIQTNIKKKEFLKQIETEVTNVFLIQNIEENSPKSLYLKLFDSVTMIFDKQLDKLNGNNI